MTSFSAQFSDIQTHWARSFIEALAQRGIVRGFPDGSFRPEQAISRGEFAIVLQTAFPRSPKIRPYQPFLDVPASYWAAGAIRWAYETGFISGYPGQLFRPTEPIARSQTLAALMGGLKLSTTLAVPLAALYEDASQIPGYATNPIAAATVNSIVVNYPALRRLRPTQPTTRAEMAAFVYQCLVVLQQASAIASNAIVRWQPSQTVQVSHPREFRAAWVTSVWNKDFPSEAGLTTQQQQAEFIALVDRLQAMNFNALILQVRPEGDALYRSSLEPWSHWLTGTQGKAPNPMYDPLEFAIAQCHQRNIELHAWFNPYRARSSRHVNAAPHLAVTNPEVVYTWGNQLWMDPGATVVQDRTYNVILDVVKRYDVDGIHLDDYFYPYPIAGQSFPDDKTYQAYRRAGGSLALGDWRRDNVNRLVQRLATGIRSTKPSVKFGISPFGIYRPGQPPSIQGLDAYEQLYADALKWLQQGWLDYLSPQLYWRIDAPNQSYPVLLNWWAANNPQQRHLYPGNNLAQLDGKAWELAEIERQIAITRQLAPKLVLGNLFFSMDAITQNRQGVGDRFRTVTYRTPALAPTIPWLTTSSPALPTGLKAAAGKLTWNPAPSDVRSWTLYQKTGDQWILKQILPAGVKEAIAPPGTYALSAVNRLAVESAAVVIAVT